MEGRDARSNVSQARKIMETAFIALGTSTMKAVNCHCGKSAAEILLVKEPHGNFLAPRFGRMILSSSKRFDQRS
jgi:hypothetical protein